MGGLLRGAGYGAAALPIPPSSDVLLKIGTRADKVDQNIVIIEKVGAACPIGPMEVRAEANRARWAHGHFV
jgi:hypothetical protein